MTSAPAPSPAPPDSKRPRPPPWWRTLRADAPFVIRFALGAVMVALIILVWWFLTRGGPTEAIVSPSKLPSPGTVFIATETNVFTDARDPETGRPVMKKVREATVPRLLDRDLEQHVFATLKRVLIGVLLAALIGIGLGVLAGSYRAVSAALTPVVIFLRSVPMGALLPLTVIWFSTGESQKEKFIFLAVVPFVFSDTIKAISAVPQRYVETAETLGATRFQIVRKVLFPLALPDIITSLRFQFGLALGYVMLAEAINADQGLGALLNAGERAGVLEEKYLLLFVIALLAFALDVGIRFFQRGLFHYRKDL